MKSFSSHRTWNDKVAQHLFCWKTESCFIITYNPLTFSPSTCWCRTQLCTAHLLVQESSLGPDFAAAGTLWLGPPSSTWTITRKKIHELEHFQNNVSDKKSQVCVEKINSQYVMFLNTPLFNWTQKPFYVFSSHITPRASTFKLEMLYSFSVCCVVFSIYGLQKKR